MKYDVLALGGYCLDLVFTDLDGIPEIGREVFSRRFAMIPGGTYNAVTTLHRLGVKTSWLANFGDDDFSRFVLDQARIEGLDSTNFQYLKKPLRNITVASSFHGDRAFISYSDPEQIGPAYLKKALGSQCRILFIGGLYTGKILSLFAGQVHNRGTLLVMDGNSSSGDLQDRSTKQTLRQLDIFLPNAREARRLVGEDDLSRCISELSELTKMVVIKDGLNGAFAMQNGEMLHVPGIKVKCIDTTGAGDCFDAGFLKAFLSGADLETCLMCGNIVGGLSTQGCGGTGIQISVQDVNRNLKKFYGISNTVL